MNPTNPGRRDFLKSSAIAGTMVLTVNLPLSALAKGDTDQDCEWCVYVTINPDNTVMMSSPVMDMGQHMKTTGPMMLADEMDLDWSLITFTQDCPAYLSKNEEGQVGYKYSDMGTGGSHAVRRNWDYMRRAGATARRMLMEQAAILWGVPAESLTTQNSFVINPATGKKVTYGFLAEGAAKVKIAPQNVKLKAADQYHIMGKATRTIDLHDIVTGKPLFGIDATYPNALQAVILRAPAQGASIKQYNKKAALKVPGVRFVTEIKPHMDTYWQGQEKQIVGAGIAVVADTLWAAMQGKARLDAQWQESKAYQNQSSAHQLQKFTHLVKSDAQANVRKEDGDVKKAFTDAKYIADEVYTTPLFAHACMEPFNCIADIRENDATVVVGHQFPHDVAEAVEKLTGIDALKVEVVSKRMGGGFGRRFEKDFLYEAIALSQQIKHPVKITWTREDEIERDFYAPAYVMRVQASLDDNNRVSGWHHRQAQTRGGARDDCFPRRVVKNFQSESVDFPSKIATGPWRGPGHMQWTFAVESMIDELAVAAQADQLDFRLKLMQPYQEHQYDGWGGEVIDSGRMAKCYERAAQMADWKRTRPEGIGLGIAGHFTFGSYAAFVIEVAVNSNHELDIRHAWGAIDCGFAINPNHVKNQMEGGFVDGLSAALFHDIQIENGRTLNNNFHTLRLMKMKEAPRIIEVDIIENDYPPTGVGEPPTAPAAAALTNAIFAASGKRIRTLPVASHFRI